MAQAPAKIVAISHLTLDGIYQAPARADEDTRSGFTSGGWAMAGNDIKMQEAMGAYMAKGWSLLLGRVTYEGMYEGWQVRQPSSPMTAALTGVEKFVVSGNAGYTPAWDNSVLLTGDVIAEVKKLKHAHDKTLVIFGSGVLVNALLQHNLVDDLLLMIHPLTLGNGRRFFSADTPPAAFQLASVSSTPTGVLLAAYQRK